MLSGQQTEPVKSLVTRHRRVTNLLALHPQVVSLRCEATLRAKVTVLSGNSQQEIKSAT